MYRPVSQPQLIQLTVTAALLNNIAGATVPLVVMGSSAFSHIASWQHGDRVVTRAKCEAVEFDQT